MAKDQTEIGITGLPIPKKTRSPKNQYEFEKERRKNLGPNVGGQTYSSDVTPGYNPREKTFEEFMAICRQLDEIAAVPIGKKLTYKGGEPLPPSHKKSLETISKMNRGIYPDNKPKTEPEPSAKTPPTGRKYNLSQLDRSNASTQGNTRRGPGARRNESH